MEKNIPEQPVLLHSSYGRNKNYHKAGTHKYVVGHQSLLPSLGKITAGLNFFASSKSISA